MAIPGVPKGLRRQVLAGFVAALKTSPKLANKHAVKTWLLWDGSSPVAEPTVDMMPACRVRMLSGPIARKASTRLPGRPMTHVDVSSPMILIDLWTRGTDQGDLSDLADLIYQALAPADPLAYGELQDRMKAAGIADWQPTREIAPVSEESFGQQSVSGQGAYQLTVFFTN
jgi:hypothetical protein